MPSPPPEPLIGEPPAEPRPPAPFSIVGIGASAGGLEAFTQLLQALPSDTGLGFVLVQHLAPAHPSALAAILSRATSMPVLEVQDEPRVRPNHVYVIPPGRNMTIANGALHLLTREAHGLQRPIDVFFQSLAEEQAHQAIGVILSGTATDGTLGLEAIKAEGGITFAQDDTAQQPSMPRSAVAAGCVDFVLPPDAIAREIARIARHPYVQPPPVQREEPAWGETLERIVRRLHRETGVDFSRYKVNTLHRRVSRRVILHRLEGMPEYLRFLERTPAEVGALQQDLLIGVTSFFRDPDAFAALQTTVFPGLLQDRRRDDPVRVWVVGCSTGEEAYSLAMTLTEVVESGDRGVAIQVFATDLSAPAIDKARAGTYPRSAVQDVSPERLRRFFVEVDGSYRVAKAIRDRCIFARHNMLVDPPFSRVDLVSCRNVLIYLETAAQQRVVATLHYALRPGGVLWLGGSETITAHQDLFEVQNPKHRIFAKRPGSSPDAIPLMVGRAETGPGSRADGRDRAETAGAADVRKEAERMLLSAYAPPGALISPDLEILQVWGDTGAYLSPTPGRASLSLHKMLRPALLIAVRGAIVRARTEEHRVRTEDLRVESNGGVHEVAVEVVPLRGTAPAGTCLILFHDATRAGADAEPATRLAEPERAIVGRLDDEVDRLTQELAATREYLQAVIEQQEGANEELQSANEEAQSVNEELQSVNEELQTSKEEIQSTNEELATVNDELKDRNVELGRTNNDLNNLISGVHVAVVIVGRDLRIRRFTALAERMLGLIPADLGRPIRAVRLAVPIPDLDALLAESIDTLGIVEREILDDSGRWHLVRIRPYRTLENQIDGAVMMVLDIDAVKRAHEYASGIVATVRAPLLVLDPELRVRTANPAFYQTFEVTPESTEGQLLYELGNGQWNIPALRRLLEEVLPLDQNVVDFEVDHEFEQIGRRIMLLNARRLIAPGGPPSISIFLSIEDVTLQRRLEADSSRQLAELSAADRSKDEFLAMLAHELRNPLGPLQNALHLAQQGPRADAATTASAWQVMDRQLGHLTRLVDDLVDAARVTSGRIVVRKELVDVPALVRRTVDSIESTATARGQGMTLSVPTDERVLVAADPTRLEQVLGNLLRNASKFTGEGGHIWVTVEIEPPSAGDGGGSVVVRVRDDGIGIAPEMLPRVFDLFAQADQTLARSRGGLGVGLTIVRRVVELHGGRVEARSAGLGHGSEFLVHFPRVRDLDARAADEATALEPSPGLDAVGQRVLVVEDNPDSSEMLALLLRADGYDVRTAIDGPTALAIAATFQPEVVLLDLGLPGMDGYEVAARLRQLPRLDSALIIAVTGYGQERDRALSRRAGFDQHVTKPVDHARLLRLLRSEASER
jgi:two-component system CheB/CheR fusion protein